MREGGVIFKLSGRISSEIPAGTRNAGLPAEGAGVEGVSNGEI